MFQSLSDMPPEEPFRHTAIPMCVHLYTGIESPVVKLVHTVCVLLNISSRPSILLCIDRAECISRPHEEK